MTTAEMEAKIVELEKRVKFLYKSMEMQLKINDKCISFLKQLQETETIHLDTINAHTIALEALAIKVTEERP